MILKPLLQADPENFGTPFRNVLNYEIDKILRTKQTFLLNSMLLRMTILFDTSFLMHDLQYILVLLVYMFNSSQEFAKFNYFN